jgi:ATP-dependent Clp endopeptidase proteolytic subunit ClpP
MIRIMSRRLSTDRKLIMQDETRTIIDLASAVHDLGVSLPTRTIFISSESVVEDQESGVDSRMADRFVKNLHILESLSPDPITVVANNPGGDVYHGLAIYDAIRSATCKLTVAIRGHAMSMGSVILQAAPRRLMSRHSTQMIHYGTAGASGHAKTVLKWAEESKRLDRLIEDIYLSRIRGRHPRFTREKLVELLDHDTFLTAEQSIELGLADEVG